MYLTITKEIDFDAAHSLPGYNGLCANLHGHSWKVLVTLKGHANKETGMLVDFKELKKAMKKMIKEKYDHKHLNDIFPNPTAEIIVTQIANNMMLIFGSRVFCIRMYETPTSYVEWCKGD